MIKNGEYEGEVCGLGTDGEGIIKCEGTTAFVPFCLVGERVRFRALKVKGNVAYGKLTEVLIPSAQRVSPVCAAFGKCGGCDLQHIGYAAQLEFKRGLVFNALSKIGGLDVAVNETVPCASEYGYRNKLALPIGVDGEGRTVVGFYARRSHRIVEAETCAIQFLRSGEAIAALKRFIAQSGLCGYGGKDEKGVLRHFVAREIKGKFIFALVASKDIEADALASELAKTFDDFTLLLNVNPEPNNVIFGNKWRVVSGAGYFDAEENGIKYRAGANTFLQVNDDVRAKLYSRVLKEVDGGNVAAIDLYSGGGMLTAMLSEKCGKAYGIEVVQEASRCADVLAKENGLQGKMINVCGTVEDNVDKVIAATEGMRRVIVCDPPRKGMERSVVRAVARSKADKIVLVSCNPATLARDLGLLTGALEEVGGELLKSPCRSDYTIDSVTPFDMFPQTANVETLVVLSRKK